MSSRKQGAISNEQESESNKQEVISGIINEVHIDIFSLF